MKKQQPTEKKVYGGENITVFEHPAFGIAQVSRWNGGKSRLFGSDLSHSGGVTLRVSRAILERRSSYDRYSSVGEETIVEFKLSEVQWARLVASAGIGEGTPVTLSYYNGENIPGVAEPAKTKKEVFADEMRSSVERAVECLQRAIVGLESAVESKSLSKKTLREIVSGMKATVTNLPASLSFVSEMFQREVESASEHAKAEIEAHANAIALKNRSENPQKQIESDT